MTRARSLLTAWAAPGVGVVLIVIGCILAAGGAWLIALGGSFYYLPAAMGLILSGYFLLRRRAEGAFIYLIVFVLTLAWAWWEVGSNGWALVPRVVGPAVLLVLLVAISPTLQPYRRGYVPALAAISDCLLGIAAATFSMTHLPGAQAAVGIAPPSR